MRSGSRQRWRKPVLAAFGFYLAWTFVTYLLEGQQQTLLRPNAAVARLAYTFTANMLIGIVGGIWLVGQFVRRGLIRLSDSGFKGGWRTLVSVTAGLLLGLMLYAVQGAPSWNPIVLANLFSQVLVVSAAEVLVCWAVAGQAAAGFLRPGRGVRTFSIAIVISSILFGVYHFAHSPPFNSLGMVLLLSVVGLATGLFYFASRDVLGTVAFHNMLALYGVAGALARDGALGAFEQPVWPLIATAAATLGLLVGGYMWLRRYRRPADDANPTIATPTTP